MCRNIALYFLVDYTRIIIVIVNMFVLSKKFLQILLFYKPSFAVYIASA